MGLLSRFRSATKQANSQVFSFLLGSSAPDMKSSEYLAAYKGWVYTCTNAIAEAVATLDLKLQRLTGKQWQDVESHLALTTLQDVNQFMSSRELIIATQSFLELDGNTFWYLPRGSATGKPAEIWVLDPSRVSVVKSSQDFIAGYVLRNDKQQEIPFEVNEILHFKRFNPVSRYRGVGTVAASALAIDTDTYSAQWNRNFFFNSAMPSATLEMDGTMTQEQMDRVKTEWNAKYKGVDNAHKLAILQGGLKFRPASLSQKEMDFLEQRRFTRDEIYAMFRVPKSLLGTVEDVNRANAEATEYIFAKHVVKPRMEFIIDRLNEFYLPLFGLNQKEWRFVLTTDPVPENRELKLKEEEVAINVGFMTRNEVRANRGLPPVDGHDEIWLPLNLTPAGRAQEPVKSKTTNTAVIAIQKDVTDESVEKRIQFITNEAMRRQETFQTIFAEAGEAVVRSLKSSKAFKKVVKKGELDELLRVAFAFLTTTFIDKLRGESHETLEVSLAYAGAQTFRKLDLDLSFDLQNPRVASWLNEHALRHATQIGDTIRAEIRERIVAGVQAGLGVSDIADSISQFFDNQASWRALRVARTEVVTGYAQGSVEGYRQSGVVKMKRWLTARDDRVDDHCLMNESDGAIVLNASFSSGHDAPPVHPNCRCTLVPEV